MIRADMGVARLPVIIALVSLLALGSTVAAADEVVVIGEGVAPRVLRIELGTTVTWQNRDDERHRMRSKDGPMRFDSKNLEPGGSWSHTFTVPGTYPVYDHRNRDDARYHGRVVVADNGEGASTAPIDRAEVTIVDDAFVAPTVTVTAGGKVEWVNRGADEHTVTARDLSFDSGDLVGGASYTMDFQVPGEFAYFCAIHPEMQGVVEVVEPELPADDDQLEPTTDLVPEDVAVTLDEAPSDDPPAFTAPELGSALESLETSPPE